MLTNVSSTRLLFGNGFSILLSRPCRLDGPLVQGLFLLNRVADEQQFVLTPLMEEVKSHLDDVFGLALAWLLKVFELSIASNRRLDHFILITCRGCP